MVHLVYSLVPISRHNPSYRRSRIANQSRRMAKCALGQEGNGNPDNVPANICLHPPPFLPFPHSQQPNLFLAKSHPSTCLAKNTRKIASSHIGSIIPFHICLLYICCFFSVMIRSMVEQYMSWNGTHFRTLVISAALALNGPESGWTKKKFWWRGTWWTKERERGMTGWKKSARQFVMNHVFHVWWVLTRVQARFDPFLHRLREGVCQKQKS